jgi:glycosyltransferase involved in cell wall biosynthesis
MKIALVVPPFIPVPPVRYGGTELFIAHLAEGLLRRGHHPVVYATGDSRVSCELKWLYREGEWPLKTEVHGALRSINHESWACADAAGECDIIHLNNAPGLAFTRFQSTPAVYTLHHPYEPDLSEYYEYFPKVNYVAISAAQAKRHQLKKLTVIHHGVDLDEYRLGKGKRDYFCFIGRVAPNKGTHLAIEVAQRSGIPLKIAGEIQPIYQEYWEQQVKPKVDGRFIEYIGEADLETKNELFCGARALLFPIDWEEPFGLVTIEAMACGTPVLGFKRGSVPEIIKDGVSGYVSSDVETMARQGRELNIPPERCRQYAEQFFSLDRMVDDYVNLYESILAERTSGEMVSEAAGEGEIWGDNLTEALA